MHSTNYILGFVFVMTAFVALVLSGMYTGLKDIHEKNEIVYNKKQILGALDKTLGIKAADLSEAEVEKYFANIEAVVLGSDGKIVAANTNDDPSDDVSPMKVKAEKMDKNDTYPLFIVNHEGKKFYILSVQGNGLWDKIWGWIALEGDANTIAGVAFGHKGETPGLGAEIKDNKAFKVQFAGRKIMKEDKSIAILVRKGGAKDKTYEVDGIGGATVTCDGVSKMLEEDLGIYTEYISKK